MITAADFTTRFAGPRAQSQAHHVQHHAGEPAADAAHDAGHVVIHVVPASTRTSLALGDGPIAPSAFPINRHPELNHAQEQPQGMGAWLRRLFRCA